MPGAFPSCIVQKFCQSGTSATGMILTTTRRRFWTPTTTVEEVLTNAPHQQGFRLSKGAENFDLLVIVRCGTNGDEVQTLAGRKQLVIGRTSGQRRNVGLGRKA